MAQLTPHLAQIQEPNRNFFVPTEASFNYPEKILQFGTGVLLRGLIDYFVDKANKQGLFEGRIVIVKSMASTGVDDFALQGSVFTQLIKGIEQGELVEQTWINNSISRVLSAQSQWNEILGLASNPDLSIIVSNTTEVGIQFVPELLQAGQPPVSFPGKLLAFLLARYQSQGGSKAQGFTIVPTELIVGNGTKLKEIVLKLAAHNNLEAEFQNWVATGNSFCNSLVDRIVPGKPSSDVVKALEVELGYEDNLLIISEVYRLWAIEGGAEVRQALGFAAADPGVVISEDITPYRERKLRLLNGIHTISVALAYLAGKETVLDMMTDPELAQFVERVAHEEFVPSVRVDQASATTFANEVLDRFRNPHIVHPLINITLQYSSKMAMRNVQTLLNYVVDHERAPRLFALGFAAYLVFSKVEAERDGNYFGNRKQAEYPIKDDRAAVLAKHWAGYNNDAAPVVRALLAEQEIWGLDLNTVADFADLVIADVTSLLSDGASNTLRHVLSIK